MLKKFLLGLVLVMSCAFLQAAEVWKESGQIVNDEGYVNHVYVGPRGNLHAGVGHLLPEDEGWVEGQDVSRNQIREWFWEDYFEAVRVADRFLPNAPDEVRMILINMAFNLGEPRLSKFVRFRKALEEERWYEAGYEMQESLWFNHVGNRAKRLVDRMFSYGRSQHGETKRRD